MNAGGRVRFATSSEDCPLELGMRFHVWDPSAIRWVLVEVTEHRSTVTSPGQLYQQHQTKVYYEEVIAVPPQPTYTGWASKPSAWDRIAGWFRGG